MCNGLVGNGADDDTKVAIGNSAKLSRYGFSICFILSIGVPKVFVGGFLQMRVKVECFK